MTLSDESKLLKKEFKTPVASIRQGDVLLRLLKDVVPKGNKTDTGDTFTLALGEKTGHHHDIVGDISIYEQPQLTLISVGPQGAELTHQEHDNLPVPQGTYELIIQREMTLLDGVHQVAD